MSERAQAVPTVRIDEPYVRVTEWRFAPGAETGWHRHEHDYVVVPITNGTLQAETRDGKKGTSPLKLHVPYTRRAGVEHNVTNTSDGELAFLEIEILR